MVRWIVTYRFNGDVKEFGYDSYELAYAKFLHFQSLNYEPSIHEVRR